MIDQLKINKPSLCASFKWLINSGKLLPLKLHSGQMNAVPSVSTVVSIIILLKVYSCLSNLEYTKYNVSEWQERNRVDRRRGCLLSLSLFRYDHYAYVCVYVPRVCFCCLPCRRRKKEKNRRMCVYVRRAGAGRLNDNANAVAEESI